MSILAAIENQERLASGYGNLQEDRLDALDRYLGRPYGDEQEGRSQVVMRDVADTIEWIKPSLMKVFAAGDEVCMFNPVGPEDEAQAEQETDWCNHVLMQKNDGFLILHDWFHDALLQKTGYVMVQYEEEERANRERFEGLTDDEFTLLVKSDNVEVLEHAQEQVETVDQFTMTPIAYAIHSAVVTKKVKYGCLKIKNIPPERVLIAADWPSVSLQGCPFVEIIDWVQISDLRQQGYEVPDDINDTSTYNDDRWEEERRDSNWDGTISREDVGADAATRRVRTRYVWMNYDEDGDGFAELRHLVVVGATILENEEDDLIPVAALTPLRQPHEHYGQSIADIVTDLQRIRTVLTRGFLDNMYLGLNSRNAVDVDRVNIDDLLISRPGGVVRVKGDPGSAVMPLVNQSQGPAILQAIEYVDTIRENRTGVTKYNQGLDANSLNKTAQGINQIMTAAQQRVEMIARIFAETGVKALMLIIHAMSVKHTRQAEMVKLRNKWVEIDPRAWKTRRDLTISVGIGTGNKDQQAQHLQMILQAQIGTMQFGTTDPQKITHTLRKMTQNAGYKNADEYWNAPEAVQPPQGGPPPEVQVKQMELQAKQQAEQQKLMVEASEKEKDRQAELQKVQIQEQNAYRMKLLDVAAGVISSRQPQPNVVDGTNLDEAAQAPMSVDQLARVAAEIDALANQMGYQ